MNYKLEFYYPVNLKFKTPIFFKFETKVDERYKTFEYISKINYDRPLLFNEMIDVNCFINLNLDKIFEDELKMKNWLLDNKYNLHFKNELYECWIYVLTYIETFGCKDNKIPLFAFWNKELILEKRK